MKSNFLYASSSAILPSSRRSGGWSDSAASNGSWQLFPYEVAQIAPLLVGHDGQLETYRGERYHDAWYQLAAAAEASISPLAGSNPSPADSAFLALLVSRLTKDAGLVLARNPVNE